MIKNTINNNEEILEAEDNKSQSLTYTYNRKNTFLHSCFGNQRDSLIVNMLHDRLLAAVIFFGFLNVYFQYLI